MQIEVNKKYYHMICHYFVTSFSIKPNIKVMIAFQEDVFVFRDFIRLHINK